MVDSVTVVDVDGRITLSNSGAVRLTGYSAAELRGMPIAKILVEDNSGLRTVAREKIAHGNILRSEESWLLTRDGQRIPVSVTASPVIDAASTLQGIVIVARDVREIRQLLVDKEAEIARRRAAEEELLAAKASIEAQLDHTRAMLLLAERRATLGTLAGGVGHELRNIAQIQVAAVDELQLAFANNEDVIALPLQFLPDLERVGEHISQHGRRLMQLGRPGPDHVAPIAFDTVVRDVVEMLRQAGKLRRVHVVIPPSTPVTVTVNRTR